MSCKILLLLDDHIIRKEGDRIGRILVIEFNDQGRSVFNEVMQILGNESSNENVQLHDEVMIVLPGLEIYHDRRKVFRDRKEIYLTTREFDIPFF